MAAAPAVAPAPYGFARSKSAFNGPDPALVAHQLTTLQNLYKKYGKALFAEQFIWILRKNPEPGEKDVLAARGGHWNKRLIPFLHNRIQRDLNANMALRNIMVKPRQAGYTTYCALMRLLIPTILEPGTGGLLVSQNYKYATAHFGILKRGLKLFGVKDPFDAAKNWKSRQLQANLLHTTYSNMKEIIFDQIDSRIMVESAENPEAGQGITIQRLHASEVARWPGNPEETLANIKEAIPIDGTIDLESTANGLGGYFYEEAMRASDPGNKDTAEFKFFFHEWWWHDEYRLKPAIKPDTMSDEEQTLRESFKIDFEQLAWRRKKMISLRHNFYEKYPENVMTAFLVQGSIFFDKDILNQRYLELQNFKPHDKYKKLVIFKPRQKHKRYIIGADPATGISKKNPDPDFSAAVVIDLETGEEMAAYRARLVEEEFAADLAELGKLYNNALIAVERTGYGGTTIVTLEVACQYSNLYKHRDWWKKNNQNRLMEFVGFPTTTKTRPIALNRVRHFVHSSPELIYDLNFVKEGMSFIYSDTGKPEAAPGAHDDTVLCRAIAYTVREVQLGYLSPEAIPSEKYGATPSEFAEEEELDSTDS